MPEKESSPNNSDLTNKVDLNSLTDLSFGPSWADTINPKESNRNHFRKNKEHQSKQIPPNIKKDRRGVKKANKPLSGSSHYKKGSYVKNQNNDFIPKFDIKIYPQDETFEALVKELKSNFITYQLFEITRLILEKSDRFICLITKTNNNEGESMDPIYYTPEDNLPFESEGEAINHYCNNYLENYFDLETVEVDPPKGNFTTIYRCPFTKHLIGPPNFHLFSDLLKEHHNSKIKNISIEEYQSKLESLSDEASINEWLESSRKIQRYRIKNNTDMESTTTVINTTSDAKNYLIKHHKDEIVRSSLNFRFPAAKIDKLQKGNLRTSILRTIDAQRRFPLDTANNIRGRLRRLKFTIYKKGTKGISYVCCVKRKFRNDSTLFTESINTLIKFIEKNQNINIKDLPYKFLSIEKTSCDKNPLDNKEISKNNTNQNSANKKLDEEKSKLTEVIRNIRWLISEGYLTEFSDGKLFIHPKTEANYSSKNEKSFTSEKTSHPVEKAKPITENIDASEKTSLGGDSEVLPSSNSNILQETENNNLEEKSPKESTAE